MENVTSESVETKDTNTKSSGDKNTSHSSEKKEEGNQLSSAVVSSTQDDSASGAKRPFFEADSTEIECDEDGQKRKKKKENEPKELASKSNAQPRTATGRGLLAGTKPPGPASKTGAIPLGKSALGQNSTVGKSYVGNNTTKTTGFQVKGNIAGNAASKSSANLASHQGKQTNKTVNNPGNKGVERKSPVPSPKQNKETGEDDENKQTESSAPKVPPLKIVIPGGVGAGSQQEGDNTGQRGNSKGRGSTSTLPYIIPCSAEDEEDKKSESGSAAQRVLRSHRATDGEKERPSPPASSTPASPANSKTPPPSEDNSSSTSTNTNNQNNQTNQSHSVELHPRKRKIKSSRDSHLHQNTDTSNTLAAEHSFHGSSNPYQQFLHIRKQIDRRQKNLFPVQPKPPQGFKDYLMNRASYTLESTAKPGPAITYPATLPAAMRDEFTIQEKERHQIRVQHNVEKEKLVLSVEQEILRVHGRAARALANQSLPFSVCTVLRDREVYNILTPEQEEKERNAQRSRYNGRLFLSWLQDVDDKWEKIKEDMVRRHHNEAQALHGTQKMNWLWKLQELGLAEHKTKTVVDPTHVPPVHVSDDFDLLPA